MKAVPYSILNVLESLHTRFPYKCWESHVFVISVGGYFPQQLGNLNPSINAHILTKEN